MCILRAGMRAWVGYSEFCENMIPLISACPFASRPSPFSIPGLWAWLGGGFLCLVTECAWNILRRPQDAMWDGNSPEKKTKKTTTSFQCNASDCVVWFLCSFVNSSFVCCCRFMLNRVSTTVCSVFRGLGMNRWRGDGKVD